MESTRIVDLAAPSQGLTWRRDPQLTILTLLFAVVVANAVIVLGLGLTKPILEAHSFRQSQTALTIYWILHGGPLLAYEMPNLGYPWSLPMEFPTYQWLVALVSLTGPSIDTAGRLVGFAFYLACLWPIRMLTRTEGFDSKTYLILVALFLGSPFYLYWSRTVMIESCAVFFDLWWLAQFAAAARAERISAGRIMALIAVGSIGALTKITTFPGFMVIAGVLFLAVVRRSTDLKSRLPTLAVLAAGTALPILATAIWVAYSDRLKAANPFGVPLMSANLHEWNFGTVKQRLSLDLWRGVIFARAPSEALGYGKWLALAALAGALINRKYLMPAVTCLLAFLAPFLVFTNLHMVHDYYQYSVGLFLLAAVGLGLAGTREWARGWICVVGLVVILAGQTVKFYHYYGHYLVEDDTQQLRYRLAELVRSHTAPGQSVIVIGFDWSSEVPYYGQRKALELPFKTNTALLRRVFDDPQSFLGDQKLGAIVYCEDLIDYFKDRTPLVRAFLSDRQVLAEESGCRLVSPNRNAS